MEEKPNYYAVIPANVRYDNELRANEKLLYAEITTLTYKTGECWANNKYFSQLYDVKPNAIATWIKHLKDKKYIEVSYKYNGKEIEQRIIKIGGIQKDNTYYSKRDEVFTKRYQGGIQKGEDNNTNINITSNNNVENIPFKEIIDYLNEIAGTNYRSNSPKTRDLIKARFNEGFTLEDFKKVIDKKFNEWNATTMQGYLRPETLFSNKFEGYLNQIVFKKKSKEEEWEDLWKE